MSYEEGQLVTININVAINGFSVVTSRATKNESSGQIDQWGDQETHVFTSMEDVVAFISDLK